MLAMRVHETGGRLVADEIDPPRPGPGEVLIEVAAAGVNFADTLMVAGHYQEKPETPFAPGLEVAGRVAALGEGVTHPPKGARVAAVCGHGGFAERVAAPAAACVAIPDAMPETDAAALQVAYGTADLALRHRAGLGAGERLLVLGAGGGVGLTAVELGAVMGAEVIAVARGEAKRAAARAAGAAHCLDGAEADIRSEVKALGGADVVYDPVGGAQWEAAMRAANPEARLLPIGFASGEVPRIPANILLVKNLTVIGLYWGAYFRFAPHVLADSAARLLGLYAAGKISPRIGHVLPLREAEAALDLLRERRATGKVVLTAAPGR
jgi:NADPH2:quinone reductase